MGRNIVEIIQKLLGLSTSSNPEEAGAAAAKVQQLLLEHNLTLEGVRQTAEQREYIMQEEWLTCTRLQKTWKTGLYDIVAKHNSCFMINLVYDDRIGTIGKKHNLEIVRYLYTYLERTIERLSVEAAVHEHRNRGLFKRSYCHGAIATINKRLEANKRWMQQDVGCRDLIVKTDQELTTEVKQHFPHIRRDKISVRDLDAYWRGKEDAKQIPLHEGVTGKSQLLLT